jgi:hypothetical protein
MATTETSTVCRYLKKECHQSPLWRILCDHLDTFLSQYDRYFLDTHGPLAPWAEETLNRLIRCGDPNFGVSLLYCKECKIKFAVPFSCKTRICPSCVNRRAEDLSHQLVERLPPQSYRHVVITFPKKMGLRKRFQQDPTLYRKFGRLLHHTLSDWMIQRTRCQRNRREEKARAMPGIIMATQSFGDELKPHAHYHLLVSDGVFFPEGEFYSLSWDETELRERIRQAVTRSLVARKLLREETAQILLSWPIERSGFSVFVGPSLTLPDEAEDVRRILRYILRSSFPLNRLNYDEKTARVDFRTTKGRFKSWPHAIQFIAALCQHIPKPRQHLVIYAGYVTPALCDAPVRLSDAVLEDLSVWPASRACLSCGRLVGRGAAEPPHGRFIGLPGFVRPLNIGGQ